MRVPLLTVGLSMAIVALVAGYASGAPDRDLVARERAWGASIRAGDLVFQDLDCGERCALIRQVTRSRYSHVCIVAARDGERVVWEASGPVDFVPLGDWVRHGQGRRVAVYRPRTAVVRYRAEVQRRVESYAGRPYDAYYQWDDERIYCSELIAKAYRDAIGRDLFEPHPVELGTAEARVYNMSGGRLTSGTPMVTPADLVASDSLVRVVDELR